MISTNSSSDGSEENRIIHKFYCFLSSVISNSFLQKINVRYLPVCLLLSYQKIVSYVCIPEVRYT